MLKSVVIGLLVTGLMCMKMGVKHEFSTVPGGTTEVDINNMTDEEIQVDQYLRDRVPGLDGYTLTGLQRQIVEGDKYRYIYTEESGNHRRELVVWDRPWLNKRQILGAAQTKRSIDSDGVKRSYTKTVKKVQNFDIEYAISNLFNN